MNGRSVEETRAQRKVEVRNLADVEPITPAVIPREYYYGPANSSSSPSAVLLPLKSPRSILKMNARRTIISGSEGGSSQAVMEDDEEGEITITQRNKRTLPFASSGRLSAESNIHVNDVDDDDDESDDGDPFGRTKEERRKRKRDDRMVTFASIGTEGFDLDISD